MQSRCPLCLATTLSALPFTATSRADSCGPHGAGAAEREGVAREPQSGRRHPESAARQRTAAGQRGGAGAGMFYMFDRHLRQFSLLWVDLMQLLCSVCG